MATPRTYREAGVDVAEAERAVERIGRAAAATLGVGLALALVAVATASVSSRTGSPDASSSRT